MLTKFKKELDKKGEIYLRIKARPGADETCANSIMDDDTIKINLKAKPIKGRANQELIKLLSGEFEILEKNVKIISGFNEKLKLVKIMRK